MTEQFRADADWLEATAGNLDDPEIAELLDTDGETDRMRAIAGRLRRIGRPVWEDKNWGRVWHRFYDDLAGESWLEVIPRQRCSCHYHEDRWNAFIVLEGKITVWEFGPHDRHDPYRSKDKIDHQLHAGESFVVRPKEWHQFEVHEHGRVIEVYWTTNGRPVRQDDIVRFDVGGPT